MKYLVFRPYSCGNKCLYMKTGLSAKYSLGERKNQLEHLGTGGKWSSFKLSIYCNHRNYKITIKASHKRGFFYCSFSQHLNFMTETIKMGIFLLSMYCSVKLPLSEKIIKEKSEVWGNRSPWYQELALSRGRLRKSVPCRGSCAGRTQNTAAEVPKWPMKLVGLKAAYDKWGQCNTPYRWEHNI